jgi:ribosome-binding protein aMBF1 (putative translation factor)
MAKREMSFCDCCGKEAKGQVTITLENDEVMVMDVCEKCEKKLVDKEQKAREEYERKRAAMYRKFFSRIFEAE